MSELATLARPYAEAIFERAKETKSAEKWSTALEALELVMENDKLADAVDNPRVSQEDLSGLLIDICKQYADKEAENLIKLLINNKRLNLVRQIRVLFEQMHADDEGYIEVDVKTAFPLTENDAHQLSSSLTKALKKEVHLRTDEDKTLIGGVLIKAGDLVIDVSVQGQIQKLAKRLYS